MNTGDLGRQDAEGYFWLTGRKKELIIRGGHNIDPATIEEPLHRHSVMLRRGRPPGRPCGRTSGRLRAARGAAIDRGRAAVVRHGRSANAPRCRRR